MPPAGLEPTISVGERPQTYALDRVATANGTRLYTQIKADNISTAVQDRHQSMRNMKHCTSKLHSPRYEIKLQLCALVEIKPRNT
jgi:hypothetical protein